MKARMGTIRERKRRIKAQNQGAELKRRMKEPSNVETFAVGRGAPEEL